ncbi:MAG: hypothetical protein AAGI30_02220 [Planctomycetota bacterium]
MAKMFYKLDEAAQRLGKSQDDVLAMAERGELTEFRDGDDLIFKVDQVDLLASDDEAHTSELEDVMPLDAPGGGSSIGISLEDTGGGGTGFGLADSVAPTADPKEQTGISVFDADEVDADDPGAQTQVEEIGGLGLDAESLESFGSGSGLMDLTQESDDTSLGGAGLLDDLGPADESAFGQDVGLAAAPGGGALFEGDGDDEAAMPATTASAMVAAEPFDAPGSGLGGGIMLATSLVLLLAIAVLLMAVVGYVPVDQLALAGEWTPAVVAGGGIVLMLISGGIGLVLGGKG